ncbi:MAG: diaminopimelate decarboxylase, partial [Spirochaetia bacterium]
MSDKRLPFSREKIEKVIEEHPTPFHIYDEKAIRENARALKKAFSWASGFREFFAVKALPNPHILAITKEEGFGTDCSSLAELMMSERVGLRGE